MAHWKRLQNPDYLGAYSLFDDNMKANDMVVTITSIDRKTVIGQDGKKDDCIVAALVSNKPMILNATNCKTLTKLFGSPDTNAWVGKPFTIYVATIKIAGEACDCLRIRPSLPQIQLPELNPSHPKWQGAVDAMKAGNTTLAAILKSYTVSPENQNLLIPQNIAA